MQNSHPAMSSPAPSPCAGSPANPCCSMRRRFRARSSLSWRLRLARAAGFDPAHQALPVAPAAHFHMGGIATDAEGATSMPGLWACGEAAATGLHGGNRLASNSLLEGLGVWRARRGCHPRGETVPAWRATRPAAPIGARGAGPDADPCAAPPRRPEPRPRAKWRGHGRRDDGTCRLEIRRARRG